MLKKLLAPHVDLAPLVLRLTLALLFVTSGYSKIMQQFPLTEKLSLAMQTAVGWGEFLCGLALLVGLLSRVAALGIIVIMVGAIALVTGGKDLLPMDFGPGNQGLNWRTGGQALDFAVIGLALTLVLLGSGMFSLDYLLLRWFTRSRKGPAASAPAAAAPEKVAVS
jgi:putative oxidoreductase